MPNFQYRARDKSGTLFSGSLETHGRDAVASYLDGLGYYPVSIKQEGTGFNIDFGKKFNQIQPIQAKDLIVFSRQMATLVGAGVPILSSFDSLMEQTTNYRLKQVIQRVRRDIETGSSFSGAIEKHPEAFSNLYVSMVRAGETGGVLDEILYRLAAVAEQEEETRSRIKSATMHPMIIVGTLILAAIVILTWVIPKFEAIYAKSTIKLPLPTRILIGINTIFHSYWPVMLLLVAGSIWGLRHYVGTKAGRQVWDRLKLKIPIFGPIFLKVALSRFSRTFGTLIRSGLPMLETLDVVSGTVGNVVISDVVLRIREAAREGRGVVQPMKESLFFPSSITQMVAIGEETGQMDEMMTKVSEYYDREVDHAIRNLTSALEPVLLITIGTVVLFFALAIFMPWWNMMEVFKAGGP